MAASSGESDTYSATYSDGEGSDESSEVAGAAQTSNAARRAEIESILLYSSESVDAELLREAAHCRPRFTNVNLASKAVQLGGLPLVREVVEAGVQLEGDVLLHAMVRDFATPELEEGRLALVRYLLTHKAPRQWAATDGVCSALRAAARRGWKDIVRSLLEEPLHEKDADSLVWFMNNGVMEGAAVSPVSEASQRSLFAFRPYAFRLVTV